MSVKSPTATTEAGRGVARDSASPSLRLPHALHENPEQMWDVDVSPPSVATADFSYPVTDFVGRCVLQVCLWLHLFDSWVGRNKSSPG